MEVSSAEYRAGEYTAQFKIRSTCCKVCKAKNISPTSIETVIHIRRQYEMSTSAITPDGVMCTYYEQMSSGTFNQVDINFI